MATSGFSRWLFGSGGMKRSLLVPFLVTLVLNLGVVSLTDYLAGEKAVVETASSLLLESAERIAGLTRAHLMKAMDLALSNSAIIEGDSPHPAPGAARMLARQLALNPDIDLACMAFGDGEYVEAQRLEGGRIRTGRAGRATGGDLVFDTPEGAGSPPATEGRIRGYDPRTRPWYLSAASKASPSWSEPYRLLSTGLLNISAMVPVHPAQGRLSAVVTAQINLGSLSSFLSEISKVKGGVASIVDGEGRELAISDPGGSAIASRAFLASGDRTRTMVTLKEAGLRYKAVCLPIGEVPGLDWKLVAAFPENPYFAPLVAAERVNLACFVLGFASMLFFGFLAARRVSEPLMQLGQAMTATHPGSGSAKGELDGLKSRDDEIGRLALAFDDLRHRLDESFSSINASLEEKEILLKELNHRVKNNLQIVSSLASAMVPSLRDEEARESLEGLQGRIQAMAYVHDDVFRTGEYGMVDMDLYFRGICDALRSGCVSIGADGIPCGAREIELKVLEGKVRLPVDKAMPCGLIVNEIVSHALRHGFAGRAKGSVTVLLEGEAGTASRILSITDDSPGNEPGLTGLWDQEEGHDLGASLVEALAGQLRANMERRTGEEGGLIRLAFEA